MDEDYWIPPTASWIGDARATVAAATAVAIALCAAGASEDFVAPTSNGPASVGAAGQGQRRYSSTPATGTLQSQLPPAWAALTAYVLDPTDGGINRVTNNGNLYQCKTDGLSAVSGGPTTTSADITDGTAHWTYVGAAPTVDVQANSQILALTARGVESTVGTVAPSDNDGGSYTQVQYHAYAAFPGSSAGVWRRNTRSNNKVNFRSSALWGDIGGGSGDECDAIWLELRGVAIGAPHTSSHVERADGSGSTLTTAAITTTKRCLVLWFWFGNGNVITAGTDHLATGSGPMQRVAGSSALKSLSANGYIQVEVMWSIEPPTVNLTRTWGTNNEGAQLVVVAYEDLSVLTDSDGDEQPAWLTGKVAPPGPSVRIYQPGDPTDNVPAPSAALLEDEWRAPMVAAAPTWTRSFADTDDPAGSLKGQPDEDYWTSGVAPRPGEIRVVLPIGDPEEVPAGSLTGQAEEVHWSSGVAPVAPVQRVLLPLGDPEELPAGTLYGQPDEDFWTSGVAPAAPAPRVALPLGDPEEIPIAPLASPPDEDCWSSGVAPAGAVHRVLLPVGDPEEVAGGLFGAPEESAAPAPVLWPQVVFRALVAVDDDLPVAPAIDDDPWFAPAAAPALWTARLSFDQDELAALAIEDAWSAPAPWPIVWRAPVAADQDEVPTTPAPTVLTDGGDEWVCPAPAVVVLPSAVRFVLALGAEDERAAPGDPGSHGTIRARATTGEDRARATVGGRRAGVNVG